jgi:hypothetical protein
MRGGDEKCIKNVLRKAEGTWRSVRRWENNIEIDIKEMGVRGFTRFIWLSAESSGAAVTQAV